MNNNSGKFKCPKYGYNKLCSFENFFSREEFLNNEIKTKWIFYKEEKKEWECCVCCSNSNCCQQCAKSLICCCIRERLSDDFYCLYPCYPCTSFIYLLIFLWIDLIYFLCIKAKTYIGISGKNKTDYNIYGEDKDVMWNLVEGLTEEEWNSKYKNNWQCMRCNIAANLF